MEILWDLPGWSTVGDVLAAYERLSPQKLLAYSTVKAVMQNLTDKGYLEKRAAGRANEFATKLSRDAFQQLLIGDVLRPLLETQRNPLLAHIAGELANDEASYAEFEMLLAKKRAERSGG